MSLLNHLHKHAIKCGFTAALSAVNASADDLRQHNQTAEQRAMMRETKDEQERRCELMKPAENDRR